MIDLLAILKGILPDSIIKIDKSTHISLDIGGMGNYVKVNGHEIEDEGQKRKILESVGKNNLEGSESDSYPYNVVHKRLYNSFTAIKDAAINSRDLKILKKYTKKEYMGAILMARSVHKAMFSEDSPDKRSRISDLIFQLGNKFQGKGRKFLNLMTAGYFETLIIPILLELEKGTSVSKKFNDYLGSLLRFFPTAIFVNNDTSEERIFDEIIKRIQIENIPYIIIHTMGKENIRKVDNVLPSVKEYAEMNISHEVFESNMGIAARNTKIDIMKRKD